LETTDDCREVDAFRKAKVIIGNSAVTSHHGHEVVHGPRSFRALRKGVKQSGDGRIEPVQAFIEPHARLRSFSLHECFGKRAAAKGLHAPIEGSTMRAGTFGQNPMRS
jgi:hypothetical protein